MEAVILAGGVGSRLLPHTAEIPKPLVPVGGQPIVEILLRQLKKAGVTRAYLAVNHRADQIMAVLGDGSKYGLEIKYSVEDQPLSTVGPLKLLNALPEHFVVANGDVLSDIRVDELYQHHLDRQADLTVATFRRAERIDYGVIRADYEGVVTTFSEKPGYDLTVSMGIYIFSRRVLEIVPEHEPYGFDDLMFDLLEREARIISFPYAGYWLDIGRPADYARAQEDIERIRHLLE
jgi:NDP-sugar pyrophosphorylase family protein